MRGELSWGGTDGHVRRLAPGAGDALHQWPSLSLKGVTDFEWIALGKVLQAEVFGKPLVTRLDGEAPEDGGQLVRAMKTAVVTRLGALDEAGRAALAKQWRRQADW